MIERCAAGGRLHHGAQVVVLDVVIGRLLTGAGIEAEDVDGNDVRRAEGATALHFDAIGTAHLFDRAGRWGLAHHDRRDGRNDAYVTSAARDGIHVVLLNLIGAHVVDQVGAGAEPNRLRAIVAIDSTRFTAYSGGIRIGRHEAQAGQTQDTKKCRFQHVHPFPWLRLKLLGTSLADETRSQNAFPIAFRDSSSQRLANVMVGLRGIRAVDRTAKRRAMQSLRTPESRPFHCPRNDAHIRSIQVAIGGIFLCAARSGVGKGFCRSPSRHPRCLLRPSLFTRKGDSAPTSTFG